MINHQDSVIRSDKRQQCGYWPLIGVDNALVSVGLPTLCAEEEAFVDGMDPRLDCTERVV